MTMPRLPIILLLIVALTGCGAEWFPEYERQPTTPDAFSFAAKKDQPLSQPVVSETITVSGLTAASSPISVTGSNGSNSAYSVNDRTPVSTDGTVQNGDRVYVRHTSASTVGTATTTTLYIGDVNATFTSTTVTVILPTFEAATSAAGNQANASGTVQALDRTGNVHEITVTNGFASLDNDTFFTSQNVAFLNGRTIRLRTTAPASGITKKVTLTIDGVSADWEVTGQ